MAVRNWRVRTRLNAILLIPVLLALVFGGFRVQDSLATWGEAEDAQRTAELVQAAATYGNALIDERDRTAAPLLAGERNSPVVGRYRAATDEAKQGFDKAAARMPAKPGLQRRLAIFRKQEPKLKELRQAAYSSRLDGVRTEEGYVTVQHPLMEFANELGFGTGNVTSYGRTVYSVSLAKAAESLERSIGMHLLVRPGPAKEQRRLQLKAFASYAYLERIAIEEYFGGGRPTDVALLKRELGKARAAGAKQTAAARAQAEAKGDRFVAPPAMGDMIERIASGAKPSGLKRQGISDKAWFATATGKFDAYRAVEHDLTRHAVQETEQIADKAKREAVINSAVVLAALLLAFFVAAMMARSMVRSMRSLRAAAFDVAEQRLPAIVDQLSRTDPGRVDTRVRPIPLDSRDEIGEVARAFDQVHREAVRLAAEQAMLRGNVNAIFTNLSRRNQGLVERQLDLISDLENNEADPEQLESLFRLDHLATRMRRNGENLLVLAGEDPGRHWTEPVPLVDILRAASSEVEHYERIELSGVPETDIHGQVVNDLVHLLAELLENATSFSSPRTNVRVTATRLPDGRVMIEIHDKGIGLTGEDFADLNHKLADPPVVDAAVSQRMGLFVVGRLADRHGIRVQLRPSAEAGTTSLVMLPEPVTQGGGGEEEPVEEDFTVSRIIPDGPDAPPRAAYEGRQGSAAEYGFDDPRFDGPAAPAPGGPHDPVGRNLMREERRAALEAQQQGEPRYEAQGPPAGAQWQGGGQYSGQQPRHELREPPQQPQLQPPRHTPPQQPEQPGPREAPYGQQTYDQSYERFEQPYGPYEPSGYDAHGPQAAPQGYGQGSEQPQVGPYPPRYARSEPEAESAPGVPDAAQDRVGFDRPGPSPSGYHSTTGAGLPRREPGRSPNGGASEAQYQPYPVTPAQPSPGLSPAAPAGENGIGGEQRSANDERWAKAGSLREPQAGGLTASGLPRRVPRANLVEGTAEQDAQGGPSVSRAPEDVRGRLSNLHRGIRRGRTGSDGTQNDRKGFGPGSTYDQER